MTRDERREAASDPALEKTVSAEEAGVTPGGAAADGARLAGGTKLGRYEIVEFIGGGGMGWVYRAKDTELERDVAIKVVQPTVAGPKGRDRLLAEARAMAKLRHRAVVPVHDVGEYAGGVYVAMALVKGGTLHDWMHAEARPWRQVVARFLEAGRGLVAAHAAGIVHRDFKPRNVLLGEAGEVMVADFGIASASAEVGEGEEGAGGTREATSIVGTPAYMAPEQAAGQAVDARADQYSFCVSLWEGLHGQRPQEAETRTQGALLERSPAAPKSRRRVPGWLTDTVARGFAPAAEKRWPTLEALLERLERGLGRRRVLVLGAGGLGAATVLTLAIVATRPGPTDVCPVPSSPRFDIATRAQIEAAFLASASPLAADVLPRVLVDIDDKVARWRARMVEVCKATHVEHSQSSAMLERRMMCLDRHGRQLQQLIHTFATADREVVAGAVPVLEAAPALADCERPDLADRPLPPVEQRAAVAEVEAQIGAANELRGRVRYQEAVEAAQAAVSRARAIGWSPTVAEALGALVSAQVALNVWDRGSIEALIVEAGKAKDDLLLLVGLTEGVALEATSKDAERAGVLETGLLAASARVDGHADVKVRALVVMANRARYAGDPQLAVRRLAAAAALADSPRLKATVLLGRARLEKDSRVAAELYGQAAATLEAEYGAASQGLAQVRVDLAFAKLRAGDVAGAESAWRQAKATYDRLYGSADSPLMAEFLMAGGMIGQWTGRIDEAVGMMSRANESFRAGGLWRQHAQGERNLGNVLANEKDDRPGAELHYRRALEVASQHAKPDSVEYADVEASLGIFLAGGDCAQGLALLEHARGVLAPLRHPSYPPVLGQLADCTAEREPDRAAGYYAAALQTCEDRGCEPGMREHIQLGLGRLLTGEPATRARGLALLQQARAGFERLGDTETAAEAVAILRKWKR